MTNVDKAAGPARRGRLVQIARPAWMTAHTVIICMLSYFASVLLVNVSGLGLHRLGLTWTDSVLIASMIGFLCLLVVLLWAFSRRSILLTWIHVGTLTAAAGLLNLWLGCPA